VGINIYTVYIRILLTFFTLGFKLELNIKDDRLKERGVQDLFFIYKSITNIPWLLFCRFGQCSVRLEFGIQDEQVF
jgi:hypothetical protein